MILTPCVRRSVITTVLAFGVLAASGHVGAERQSIQPFSYNWRIEGDPSRPEEPVAGAGWYRLTTPAGQLTRDGKGVALGSRATLGRNTAFRRLDCEECPYEGPHININVGVGIYVRDKGYLVFSRSDDRLRWQADSNWDPMSSGPSAYQWIFRDADLRDHRRRPVKTGEELRLFNVVKKQYLVYDQSEQRLRWKPN